MTAFIQLVWYPEKFGLDKRTSHLSSMIVSGQLTRDEALKELEEPLYDKKTMDGYIKVIKENLGITDEEFETIMKSPSHQHSDYKLETDTFIYKILHFIRNLIRRR